MEAVLTAAIQRLFIQNPIVHRRMSVFPLISSPPAVEELPFLPFEGKYLNQKKVELSEPAEGTKRWWEKLYLQSRLKEQLFLPEGVLLQGGRQNRILARAYLIPQKGWFSKKYELQTYCVERLRSRGNHPNKFLFSGFAPVHIRALGGNSTPSVPAKQEKLWDSISRSLSASGFFLPHRPPTVNLSGQTGLMSARDIQKALLEISSEEEGNRTRLSLSPPSSASSPAEEPPMAATEDLTIIYRQSPWTKEVEQKAKQFEVRNGQVGWLVVIRGKNRPYIFLDLFWHPELFRVYTSALTRSYLATEHILEGEEPEVEMTHLPNAYELAEHLLRSLKLPYFLKDSQRLPGQSIRILHSQAEASGLIWEEKLIYLRASNCLSSFVEIELDPEKTFVVGREFFPTTSEDTQFVRLEDPLVSRKHGKFFFQKGKWYFQDLGSTNGSEILRKGEFQKIRGKIPLENLDLLRLGDTFVRVKFVHEEKPVCS